MRRHPTALRFFEHSPQGPEPDVTGYKGFYYHFLEMKDGRRAGKCELSTVDSGFLLAGMLVAAAFFDEESPVECEIREAADALLRRAHWPGALYGVPCNAKGWPTETVEDVTIIHGGTPENGFISHRYQGYDESLLMHVLSFGSSTFPLPAGVLPRVAETIRVAKAIWRDGHVSFSSTKRAFDPELWDKGEDHTASQNPGDNPRKFRTIVSFLRP